jgi:hypothetical protein
MKEYYPFRGGKYFYLLALRVFTREGLFLAFPPSLPIRVPTSVLILIENHRHRRKRLGLGKKKNEVKSSCAYRALILIISKPCPPWVGNLKLKLNGISPDIPPDIELVSWPTANTQVNCASLLRRCEVNTLIKNIEILKSAWVAHFELQLIAVPKARTENYRFGQISILATDLPITL